MSEINIDNVENENENEALTPLQRAKAKYFRKNKERLMQQNVIYAKKRYHENPQFRESVLESNKKYYEANKEKKRQYNQLKKKEKLDKIENEKIKDEN